MEYMWKNWLARYLWLEKPKDTSLENEKIKEKECSESEQTAPP